MTAGTWYYAVGQDQKGPFTVEQIRGLLRDNTLDRDTFVWGPALSDWQPLHQTELASLIAAPVPRVPPIPSSGGLVAAPASAGFSPAFASGGSAQADFVTAVQTCLAKFTTWQGRAPRPEYWYFFLFALGLNIIASAIDLLLAGVIHVRFLQTLVSLALLLPNLAVAVRRLHDTGRSAWWLLIGFVPLVGWIVLIVFFAQPSQPTENQYGPPPV